MSEEHELRPMNKPPPLFYARHFEWLARAIRVAAKELGLTPQGHQKLVNVFVEYLSETNERFDAERFRATAMRGEEI